MAAGATETPALLRRSGLGRHPQLGRVEHLATLGAMIADAPSGRVIGARRVMVRYDLTRSDAGRLVRAITAMGRILFAAGATAVVTGIRGYETVRNQTELAEAAAHGRRERLHVAAFHPTGTARMGADDQSATPSTARGGCGACAACGWPTRPSCRRAPRSTRR